MTCAFARSEPRQRGFTLLELMVVVIILGLLATLVAPNVFRTRDDAERAKAQSDLRAIASTTELWLLNNRKLPSLADLVARDQNGQAYLKDFADGGLPADPWGTPYVIRAGDKPGLFEVISCGADKREGSEDDLSSARRPN
jgi:general secretion pathway protein G